MKAHQPLVVAVLGAFVALGFLFSLAGPAAPVTDAALKRLGFEPAASVVKAPDFLLPTLDGSEMSLAEHRGRVVLLNFWTTW